jgi:hypothetical protein
MSTTAHSALPIQRTRSLPVDAQPAPDRAVRGLVVGAGLSALFWLPVLALVTWP